MPEPSKTDEFLELYAGGQGRIALAIRRTESAVYKALQRIHEELFDCVEDKMKGSDRR